MNCTCPAHPARHALTAGWKPLWLASGLGRPSVPAEGPQSGHFSDSPLGLGGSGRGSTIHGQSGFAPRRLISFGPSEAALTRTSEPRAPNVAPNPVIQS
jgi:hypothetical protein